MIVLRSLFAIHAVGLLLAFLLAAFIRTAEALYMPQQFNLTAARNETDSRFGVAENPATAGAGAAGRGGEARILPRDVWSPEILSPDGHVVWTVGSNVAVKWDAAHPPGEVTDYIGKILLGWEEGDDGNEHLDFEHPLAEGFNLTQGSVIVQVPIVPPSNHYFVVLIGDSGNRSPSFTILGRSLLFGW